MSVFYNQSARLCVCVPTMGRPKGFNRLLQSIQDTATTGRVSVLVDIQGKPDGYDLNNKLVAKVFESPVGQPTVYRWNRMFYYGEKQSLGDFYMLGADDMVFLDKGWDEFFSTPDSAGYFVFHLQDTRDVDGTPHPIVKHTEPYLVHPGFLHWYGDTHLVENARNSNEFKHIRTHRLAHIKPSDVGVCDETHLMIRKMGWRERDKEFYNYLKLDDGG